MQTLKLTSNTLFLDIDDATNLHSANVGDFNLSEYYTPNSSYHGQYKITITKSVKTKDNLSKYSESAYILANQINDLITYVIGYPLNLKAKDYYGSKRALIRYDVVDGWESNFQDIKPYFILKKNPRQKLFTKVYFGDSKHWTKCKYPPLKELIDILTKYNQANSLVKQLIRFHTLALHHVYDVKYLLLSKALEIAKTLLPIPNNDKKSFEQLPEEIRKAFNNRSISWLYGMSNYRYETRHVINKKSNSVLHNEMNKDEYFDFMLLSDILISYLVRKELGLSPLIYHIK